MNPALQRGIALARAGKRMEARIVLLEVIENDERNEDAWLWLSGVVEDPEDIQVCLENVLAINPENPQARQGLEWLIARYGLKEVQIPADIQTTLPSAEPEPEPEPVVQPVAVPARQPIAEVQTEQTLPAEPDNPCPYCGAPTTIGQRNCLKCRRSLMIRTQPKEQRSIWVGLLAGLHFLNAVFYVLGGLGILLLAVLAYQVGQNPTSQAAEAAGSPLLITTLGVVVLLFAGLYFALGRGMLQRAIWAYYVTIGLTVLSWLVYLASAALAAVVTGMLPDVPQDQQQLAAGSPILGYCGIILQLAYVLLVAACYRDFFGPMRRFQPVVTLSEPTINYNNGVAYKDRGMWYMAMREWEQAVTRAPYDLNYLHGLGLAYAQVGRFSEARATLDKALQIAPTHLQIKESRALVERMAASG